MGNSKTKGPTPGEILAELTGQSQSLNESQRAMIAARFMKGNARFKNQNEMAALFKIGRATVSAATQVLDRATPEEIDGIDSGRTALSSLYHQIVSGLSADERVTIRTVPRSSRGKFPAAIQQRQAQHEVWVGVRTALTSLTGLPLAADVAAILRSNPSRLKFVNQTLPTALQYLKDLSDDWNKRNQNSGTVSAENCDADAGNGERAAGAQSE